MAHMHITMDEITPSRLMTLTDGVFAIAMTILVLELHVPEIAAHLSSADLQTALLVLFPKFASYAISFAILGIFWIGSHNLMHFIERVDRTFLWFNIVFLMLLSLIPFSAALLGNYGQYRIAIILYGINLILIGLVLFLAWRYATRNRYLVDAHLSDKFIRAVELLILKAPLAYFIAILFSFYNPAISLLLYALVPIYYIFSTVLNRQAPWEDEHEKD